MFFLYVILTFARKYLINVEVEHIPAFGQLRSRLFLTSSFEKIMVYDLRYQFISLEMVFAIDSFCLSFTLIKFLGSLCRIVVSKLLTPFGTWYPPMIASDWRLRPFPKMTGFILKFKSKLCNRKLIWDGEKCWYGYRVSWLSRRRRGSR